MWRCGALCVAAILASQVYAQEKKEDKKPAPPAGGQPAMTPEQMKEMEEWLKTMNPGPEHEKLKPLAGSWTYTLKMRHGGPEAPWQEMSGTIERKWIMGGRYLMETVTGPPLMPGMPNFEGMALIGYDNVARKHWFIWVDNAGTGSMNFTGTSDSSGKTFTYSGEYLRPDGKSVRSRHVLTIKDDKTHTAQAFEPGPDGKEFMSFDMTCTRK